ncbi:MAG: hypothetical protein SV422_02055 [Pseudomonadota bacterium]|nr:hypothetical protein [Pseudomonadota bacterium]
MILKRLSPFAVALALAACGGDATSPAGSANDIAASAATPAPAVAQNAAATASTPVVACDRACLEGFVERYFDALIDNDPSQVPLADDVIFTEDGQRLLIGDGLWNTMKSKGPYRLFTTDVPAGQVAVLATINEDHRDPALETPALIAVRLKIENQVITQIEQLVVRNENGANNVNKMTPHETYLTDVPPENRMSRTAMIETANKYFTGMQQNDGKGDYPFSEDCHRIENGMAATNNPTPEGEMRPDPKTALGYSGQWTCLEQFESGLIHFVHRIRDRRFVAVDEERGIVFSFVFFDHPGGDTRTFETPDGRTVTAGPVQPWTWQIAELFKVQNNQITRIEAILARSPYGMNSGWSTWEEGMSDEMRDVTME